MTRTYYLKTNDPQRLVEITFDESGEMVFNIIRAQVDPFSAFSNTLRNPVMKAAREEARAHGLRVREPGRMFLRRW